MKTIKKQSTFFFLLGTLIMSSPALISCHSNPTELTAQEKETVKKEISDINNRTLQDAERLDITSAMKPYLNTSDYIEIRANGSSSNYETMKKRNIEGFKDVAAFKATTTKEEFRFLSKNQVLYTWFGKFEMALKTGGIYKTDSQITSMLFSKINNQWKIVYDHTSIAPMIKVGSKK